MGTSPEARPHAGALRWGALPSAVLLALTLSACNQHAGPTTDAGAANAAAVTKPAPHKNDGHTSHQANGRRAQTSKAVAQAPIIHLPRQTKVAAVHSAKNYLAASMTLLAHPQKHPQNHGTAITGQALAAVLATRSEYTSKHYRVIGSPRVIHQRIVSSSRRTGHLVMSVCLDNSAVHVVDKHNHRVASPPSATRVRNLFTLVKNEHSWTVVNTTFAKNPTC